MWPLGNTCWGAYAQADAEVADLRGVLRDLADKVEELEAAVAEAAATRQALRAAFSQVAGPLLGGGGAAGAGSSNSGAGGSLPLSHSNQIKVPARPAPEMVPSLCPDRYLAEKLWSASCTLHFGKGAVLEGCHSMRTVASQCAGMRRSTGCRCDSCGEGIPELHVEREVAAQARLRQQHLQRAWSTWAWWAAAASASRCSLPLPEQAHPPPQQACPCFAMWLACGCS